jgi:hypothetical protein
VLPGKNYRASHVARILLRRRWFVLLPVALGLTTAPSAERVAAAGIGGLAAGLVLTALLERRDSSFASEEDVVRALALPVLGSVSVIRSARERHLRRRRRLAVDVAGAAVLLCALALVFWRLWS